MMTHCKPDPNQNISMQCQSKLSFFSLVYKAHMKRSSAKCRPFWLGPNVLMLLVWCAIFRQFWERSVKQKLFIWDRVVISAEASASCHPIRNHSMEIRAPFQYPISIVRSREVSMPRNLYSVSSDRLKFDRHLSITRAEMPLKFQSDVII